MGIDEVLRDKLDESLDINKLYFKNKTILITGAAGSIGQKLSLLLCMTLAKRIILLDNSEANIFEIQQILFLKNYNNFHIELVDISIKESLDCVLKKHKPNIIYHIAACKHVPLLEKFPKHAFNVNVIGTKNTLDLSIKYNVTDLIFISTDKAVYPKNIMGASKRIAELYLSKYINSKQCNVKIIRFGNIPYTRGSILELWKLQLELKGKIDVVFDDVSRYFISVNRVCNILLDILNISEKSLFIADMGDPVKISDLAKMFLKRNNIKISMINKIKKRNGDKDKEDLFYNNEDFVFLNDKNIYAGDIKSSRESISLIENVISNIKYINEEELKSKMKEILEAN